MRGGSANSFVSVPVLADNGLITKTYLHDLEAAVLQRTPIAGANIDIKVTDGSYVISATAGLVGGGGVAGFSEITLTVCSNGTPATITVLAKD
jgi:hypothetical protein